MASPSAREGKPESSATAPEAKRPRLELSAETRAVVEKVQSFYDKTQDFAADFTQTYRYKAAGQTRDSAGSVQVKKPGFMRWDYQKPYPKQFILDGKALYLFEPDDNQVTVHRQFATDSLSAAVSFLWGRGKLADEFDIRPETRPEWGEVVLALFPRRAQAGYSRLYFGVDPATGMVRTSVVIDGQGNENIVRFAHVRANTGMADTVFQFRPPADAQITEWK